MPETLLKQDETARLIALLGDLAKKLLPRRVKMMEVCGTHTVTAQATGLHSVLPDNVKLISGPGCPVCVTPAGFVDQAAELALKHSAHIMTYGDMLRVPGRTLTLEEVRRRGGRVSVVYSVQDALAAARREKDQNVVFLGIGFETTTPHSAVAVKIARVEKLTNFKVLSAHKRLMPAMGALLTDPDIAIDGFIAPGHVSVIIGADAYIPVAEQYHRPCVVAGFDAAQMLMAMARILMQLVKNEPKVENVYLSHVIGRGNVEARQVIDEVFVPAKSRWRGLGEIDQSGLAVREEFADHDARRAYGLDEPPGYEPPGCRCAQVIKGQADPPSCPLFARQCTTATPIGACMVSREGACSAYYRYRKMERK
jgi:hydrogenase expression/formation protein HypD